MTFKSSKFEFLLLCALALVLCATAVQGQSGRKQTKHTPAAPVPTPTPEPTPAPTPKPKDSDLNFLVAADRNSVFESFPLGYYEVVLRACGDRLRSGSSATVDVAQQSLNRGDAIKKAKASTNTYVVWMRLVLDDMARSYDDFVLEFVVFAPQTGKVATNGRSYPNVNRKGPVIVGPTGRGTSGLFREQLLKRAGEDAADRILKSLHLNIPRTNWIYSSYNFSITSRYF